MRNAPKLPKQVSSVNVYGELPYKTQHDVRKEAYQVPFTAHSSPQTGVIVLVYSTYHNMNGSQFCSSETRVKHHLK